MYAEIFPADLGCPQPPIERERSPRLNIAHIDASNQTLAHRPLYTSLRALIQCLLACPLRSGLQPYIRNDFTAKAVITFTLSYSLIAVKTGDIKERFTLQKFSISISDLVQLC